MVRRTRAEMEETRAALLATARQVISELGYVHASMDDLTARAGLTRGALYHHFGDKQGLLAAVVAQIDAEMDARLQAISDAASDPGEGLRQAYLRMAREPHIQRIVLRAARAVLGGASPEAQQHCVASLQQLLAGLIQQQVVAEADPWALAAMVHGSLTEAAFWVAQGEEGDARLAQALTALEMLLRGLLARA